VKEATDAFEKKLRVENAVVVENWLQLQGAKRTPKKRKWARGKKRTMCPGPEVGQGRLTGRKTRKVRKEGSRTVTSTGFTTLIGKKDLRLAERLGHHARGRGGKNRVCHQRGPWAKKKKRRPGWVVSECRSDHKIQEPRPYGGRGEGHPHQTRGGPNRKKTGDGFSFMPDRGGAR